MPELDREQIIAELQEIIDHFAGSLYWTLSNALTLIKQLTEENNQFADIGKLYSEIRAEAKTEVAREIFEEFETSLVIGGFVNGEKYLAIREDDYNHYKKKYIGEKGE
jgi:hypothetical protein